MANNLNSNPKFIDAAASSTISGNKKLHLIQWIDDNGDIANDDDLDFTLNGVTIHIKVQVHETAASVDRNAIFYQAGPFSPPIDIQDFVVNTIDHGTVLVWLQ